jgi:hypothetical protein
MSAVARALLLKCQRLRVRFSLNVSCCAFACFSVSCFASAFAKNVRFCINNLLTLPNIFRCWIVTEQSVMDKPSIQWKFMHEMLEHDGWICCGLFGALLVDPGVSGEMIYSSRMIIGSQVLATKNTFEGFYFDLFQTTVLGQINAGPPLFATKTEICRFK